MSTRGRVLALVLGLLAAIALFAAPRLFVLPQDPLGSGLGPSQTDPALTVVALVALVAAAVGLRFPLAAAVLLATVTGSVVVLVWVEFRPVVYLLAVLAALATGVTARESPAASWVLAGSTVLALALVTAFTAMGWGTYQAAYGSTHPDSAAPEPDWVAAWMWVGAVTPDSATITAGGLAPGPHTLHYRSNNDLDGTSQATADSDGVARFDLADLAPGTRYSYSIVAADGRVGSQEGESAFTTTIDGPQDLTVVLGACARTGSNGAVFDRMLADAPDLYINMGDLHYANLVSDDPGDHIAALGRSLSTPAQSALVSSIPTTWVWDDHDFGDNDSDSSSPSRDAVSIAYRRAVPHHGVDPDPAESIAQAFTVGRVRFVVTDTRSMRTEASMLGETQLEWFLDELTTATAAHALVVWVNPGPWISDSGPGSDDWSAFPDERRRIADHVVDSGVSNLVMVSGDAHMVAIDDGTNSDYSSRGGNGFPVLHAAALDRPGSAKGGPYSHGEFPDGGQYGKLEVEDDGGERIRVRLGGHRWDGTELVSLDVAFDVQPPT